jgi:hypothetical protein
VDEQTEREFADRKARWTSRRANGADAGAKRFQILRWENLTSVPAVEPLIKGLLERGALSVLFGASNSGKTFFALDVALHVALGRDWCGFRTRKGPVLYIAAEAGSSIDKRLTAFRLHSNIDVKGVEFYRMTESLDLYESHRDADRLITQIASEFPGVKFELIVIDTLARVMGGGNENAPDDMGALIANWDRLRRETGAHVAVIHHTGKGEGRGERGHSALRAAVDTAIEVTHEEQSGIHAATVQKQRDSASGQVFSFKLTPVEIGRDEDNEPITSCVVERTDGAAVARRGSKPLARAARLGLAELFNSINEHAGDPTPTPVSDNIPRGAQGVTKVRWRRRLEKADVINADGNPRQQLSRIIVTLKDAGLIGVWEDFVWPVTRRHEAAP